MTGQIISSEVLHQFTVSAESGSFWAGWENEHVAIAQSSGSFNKVGDFVPHSVPDSKTEWFEWHQFNLGMNAARLESVIKGVRL